MKKAYFILGFFAFVFIVGVAGIMIEDNDSPAEVNSANTNTASNTSVMDIKGSDEAGVVVGVQPIDTEEWKFEVSLNTHVTDLSQDIAEVSILVDEKGNEYKPISWEGDPPGGHHRSGILSFGPIDPKPEKITLIVREVGGVDERIFDWEL